MSDIAHLLRKTSNPRLSTSDGRFGKGENDSIRFSATNESIRFDSIHCKQETNTKSHRLCWSRGQRALSDSEAPPHSTPGVLDSGAEAAGPVHWSHDRPAGIATELLIAFAEAISDIDANVSHDAILQHNDACSWSVIAVVLNRNFSLPFGLANRFESIFHHYSVLVGILYFFHSVWPNHLNHNLLKQSLVAFYSTSK